MAERTWTILVHGYGTFEVVGTRLAAEQAMADKCRWENAAGRIWANTPETQVERLEAEIGREFRDRGSCPMSLLNRLSSARKSEAA